VNSLLRFLRDRASEDLASCDEDRQARGRVVLMITGLTANTLESARRELQWLAGSRDNLVTRARALLSRRFPLFDPACVPAPVLTRMAVAEYWTYPADLRERIDRWHELTELEAEVAERDIGLIGAVLSR
jgi:hypothetical protein